MLLNLKDMSARKPQNEEICAELHQIAVALSPASRRKMGEVIDVLQSTAASKSLSILMTGKTGTGKSTLVNGILGLKDSEMAKEGKSIRGRCTTEVGSYRKNKEGVDVTIWDSPGLQDGTDEQDKYLEQMVTQCSQIDLTIYCIPVNQARFVRGCDNPDVVAMRKITEAFGYEFWKHTIIVLTFANMLESLHVNWYDLPEKEKAKAFNVTIKEWEEQIKEILIKDISVPKSIADGIKVVPAGHYRKPHLPGVDYWLSNLWFHCVSTVRTKETKLTLLKINEKRFKHKDKVTDEDFKRAPEEQPIVVTNWFVGALSAGAASGLAGGKMGANFGSFVGGQVGAIGTPLGGFIGAAIGVFCGVAYEVIKTKM